MAGIVRSGASGSPSRPSSALVAIALGSNIGDRAAHLLHAYQQLCGILTGVRLSSFYETSPVGVPAGRDAHQALYLNAVAVGYARLTPRALLDDLHEIERARGRERPYTNAPRTLDLDLILYGAHVLSEPAIEVPHPRFRDRPFVLDPLAEVAPDLVDPVSRLTIRQLRETLARATRSATPLSD